MFVIAAQDLLKGTYSCADALALCKLHRERRWLAVGSSSRQRIVTDISVVFGFVCFFSFLPFFSDALFCGLLFAPSWG